MFKSSQNKYLSYLFLFLIVLLSRLPFLNAGYGVEEDSWGIALEAYNSHSTGVFEPSRLPGHPVQELFYTIVWGIGHWWFNFTCAFFSAVAALFFAFILNHLKFKYSFLASLAFAFVPVFFISSTYTIDFVWTQAFVLMSFYFLLKEKLILAGVFLGLAIGCRITSGAMLLPFAIFIWQNNNLKSNTLNIFKIALPMLIVAVIAFFPIIQKYGLSFFMYYDQFPYPSFSKFMYKLIPGVWGLIGVLAILISIAFILIHRKQYLLGTLFKQPLNKKILLISFVTIALYAISYMRLPQKSGYMIPIIPFVIILFGYYLNQKAFILLCVSFIISPFLMSINLTDKLRGAEYSSSALKFTISNQEIFIDPLSGPIMSDYSKRKNKLKYTDEVIEKINQMNDSTVFIAGWWYNEINVKLIGKEKNKYVILEPYIDEIKMKDYKTKGYTIVYLPEQNIYNDLMFKINSTDSLSKPFNL